MIATVNYWAILTAGAVYMALGALWYSQALFGKVWLAGIGKTKQQAEANHAGWKMGLVLVGSLVAAYGIARILTGFVDPSLFNGVRVGVLGALCFVIAPMGVNDLMEGRPVKLFLVNAIYNLVGFVIMGAIIGFWR